MPRTKTPKRILTKLGNEIDYSECEDCGIVELNGMDIEKNGN